MMRTRLLVVLIASAMPACGKVQGDVDSASARPGERDSGVESPSGGGTAGGGSSSGGSSGNGASGAGAESGTGGAGDGSGGESGAGGSAQEPEVPPELSSQPTVWIGEVELAVTYPKVVQADARSPEKVVLILDAITSSVSGTITFGEGPLPESGPSEVYPTYIGVDGTWPTHEVNWNYSPFPGFPYSLVGSELKGNRLSLHFATAELWTGPCPNCDSGDSILRHLDLVVSGDTMAGEITRPSGNWLGSVPAIRLQRVK